MKHYATEMKNKIPGFKIQIKKVRMNLDENQKRKNEVDLRLRFLKNQRASRNQPFSTY